MRKPMHRGASPALFGFAKKLRANPTLAEQKLWSCLRNKQTGHKYRFQHPTRVYVVDFYCNALELVIEVDGDIHADRIVKMEDEQKITDLLAEGYFILRFTNDEVMNKIEWVMKRIYETHFDLELKFGFPHVYPIRK